MTWADLFFILAVMPVGWFVGSVIGEWDNRRVARRQLCYDLWLSASEAQADIAADVQSAEEKNRQVREPSSEKPVPL